MEENETLDDLEHNEDGRGCCYQPLLNSQNAFLFLATHGPSFIASSSSATLIQCGFQYRR